MMVDFNKGIPEGDELHLIRAIREAVTQALDGKYGLDLEGGGMGFGGADVSFTHAPTGRTLWVDITLRTDEPEDQ